MVTDLLRFVGLTHAGIEIYVLNELGQSSSGQ